ncbi:TonB family protein [Lysobacter sp. F6437]|uniref:TonB family protein n=1 Tax=Lysobacter sp. F6437 TaxID=3459296 RepID=UPI00403DE849
MSTPSPAPHRPSSKLAAWRPSRRALWWILGAIVAGFLLFALVWSGGRKGEDFYRVGDAPPTAAAPDYDPLPTPLPARDGEASGLEPGQRSAGTEPASDDGDEPRLVETTPPPPPSAPAAPPPPEAPAASSPASQPRPIAGRTPPPRYPNRALRRGDRGTVLVRAAIGPDGVPTSVEVADGSGSRLLDRAAVDAVERWRFHPAMVGGQPTVGTVVVPISFEPNR